MKSAVVVGGSSGIGLGITKALIDRGYYVYVVANKPNDLNQLSEEQKDQYEFVESDLFYYDESLFKELSNNNNVKLLMITAGFGRVTDFEYLHNTEIDRLMTINATSVLKIIHDFYHRIRSSEDFYCGVMGSIAGLICSPSFSVYSASKAALCRGIESINAELAANNYNNKILNVSPGSLKGTGFTGNSTDLSQISIISNNVINKILAKEELYIPEYDEVYKDVLKRYHTDPTEFGISSYKYKKDANRIINEERL